MTKPPLTTTTPIARKYICKLCMKEIKVRMGESLMQAQLLHITNDSMDHGNLIVRYLMPLYDNWVEGIE